MKNIKLTYLLILFVLLVSYSCEDVLETNAKDAFAEDLIYEDPDQVERLVYTAYNSTEGWGVNRFQWWSRRFNIEAASFEAKFNFNNLDLFKLRSVGITPSSMGVWLQKWSNYWDYVRSCNEFLDRIDNSVAMSVDAERVNVLKAEMKFLRANLYAKLINYYGGVPIMNRALGLQDDFNLERNSYEECVDFIVSELDEVAAILPETRPETEFGRATKLSALAVKSRILLYAASKLHDPSSAPANDPLYVYTKSSKWQDAADAAKEIVDIVEGRDLIAVADAEEYQKLFLSPNQDILFARPYGSAYYDFGTDANSLWDQTQSPNGYGGWGLSSPTHNFALQFNMQDGSGTTSAAFDPLNPNANREMRYYANLLFNGAQFRGRDVQYYLSDDVNKFPHGLDSPEGIGNTSHSSKTGYNIRKFQDESVDVAGGISPQRPYILYRLAEIYLNYAEALYHIPGQEVVAREYLNKVSTRALQPEITASGDELLEAIKRERRVELCFEGHNFFDERRWMEDDHLGFDIKGLKWTKTDDGSLTFVEETVVTRPWYNKHYYLPIPSVELEKAPSLLQNYDY
ncbi:RagB/SusD family nutrient uptake outer membrane protein [Saccharicrinis fermentans]|uniref:SusD family protein n=1 Tax=Saccharicrinis fermentans DSM 9555 = JCM 21142 TaxID=869213 RepID=W7Y2H8_9BACT|nr:RagB/SusD family nutrient uptake outer membrane protein [Saccharicrinis fermentans]GAF02152.1 SusD family protein [Saccharicrinis fermentans DSM 9555 = JCM 21142]